MKCSHQLSKVFAATFFLFSSHHFVSAQNTNVFPLTGNVGIGTLTPGARLSFNDVNDGSSAANGITWFNSNPLDYGIYRTAGNWAMPDFQQLKISWKTGIIINPGDQFGKSYLEVGGGGLRVTSGNVLIGKSSQLNPNYKLDVNGSIRANKVVVNATGADFVFDTTYNLRSLCEVKQFIEENKHLPEIPSAKSMQAEGVSVGDMEMKLLQKIEELTLYIIKQQEEIEAIKRIVTQKVK